MEVTTRANPSGSVLASGWRRMTIHGTAVRMPAAGNKYVPGRIRSLMTRQPRKEAIPAEPGCPSTFSGGPPPAMPVGRHPVLRRATSTGAPRKRTMLPGMTARFSTRLAWAGCGLSVLCAVVGALAVFSHRRVTSIPELLLIAGTLAYSGIGALIAMRQPANRIGWLLLLIGVLSSVCIAASGYALVALV